MTDSEDRPAEVEEADVDPAEAAASVGGAGGAEGAEDAEFLAAAAAPAGFSVSEPTDVKDPDVINTVLRHRLPRRIMIQTTSACNSSCIFCPHTQFRDKLPQGRMSDELFRSIIEEMSQVPEQVRINLFLMNDPLMDSHIVEKIHLAKEIVPNSIIGLWTNGALLNDELTERLLTSPLDGLGVSLHAHDASSYERITGRDDFDEIREAVLWLAAERLAHQRLDLTLMLRFVGAGHFLDDDERQALRQYWADTGVLLDILVGHNSRAGLVTSRVGVIQPRRWMAGCGDEGGPRQAHVLFNGKVVMCCMDYQRKLVLGDLSGESLEEIWTGDTRRQVLRKLYGLREAEPGFLCSACEWSVPVKRKR